MSGDTGGRADSPPDGAVVRRNLRIRLAYDGSGFHGWQIQPAVRTVQGEICAALTRVLGEPVRVTGASRTDAGVHALEQVANVRTTSPIGCGDLARALNALTGHDLVVMGVDEVPPDFHARFSATGKRYRYRIRNEALREPWTRAHAWHVPPLLDVSGMRAEASVLVGSYDFASFQATGSEVASTVREVRSLDVVRSGAETCIVVVADGFLRHMVRNIVGTLVAVGLGHRPIGSTAIALSARDRAAAGPTAPAHGLWLEQVFYPSDAMCEASTR